MNKEQIYRARGRLKRWQNEITGIESLNELDRPDKLRRRLETLKENTTALQKLDLRTDEEIDGSKRKTYVSKKPLGCRDMTEQQIINMFRRLKRNYPEYRFNEHAPALFKFEDKVRAAHKKMQRQVQPYRTWIRPGEMHPELKMPVTKMCAVYSERGKAILSHYDSIIQPTLAMKYPQFSARLVDLEAPAWTDEKASMEYRNSRSGDQIREFNRRLKAMGKSKPSKAALLASERRHKKMTKRLELLNK